LRANDSPGFTLIETLIAGGILLVICVAVIADFRNEMATSARERQSMNASQLEEAVRRTVFRLVRNYIRGASPVCTQAATPILGILNGATASGVNFTRLDAASSAALLAQVIAQQTPGVSDPSFGRYNRALERCQNSSLQGMPNGYLSANAGVYFCLRFTADPAIYRPSQNDMLTTMTPVFGEFFFTNVLLFETAGVLRGEVRCPSLAPLAALLPPAPVISYMYYTLYWSPRLPNQRTYNSATGMISLGAG
jgi:type II secretory pathway pseudopilin PulG